MPLRPMSEISEEEFNAFVNDLTLPLAETLEEEMGRNGPPKAGQRLERYRLVQSRIRLLKPEKREGVSEGNFHHPV